MFKQNNNSLHNYKKKNWTSVRDESRYMAYRRRCIVTWVQRVRMGRSARTPPRMSRVVHNGFYANVDSLPAPTEDSLHADNDKVARSLISRYLDGGRDQSPYVTSILAFFTR